VNYLGIAGQVNIPGTQSVTQDMLSLQLANTFVYQTTANGATASFTLNAPPVSANSLVVSANGVVQYDYSVNGTNLTFGFTPPVGTFIRITSLALAQAGVPADGSVTSVKLGSNLTLTGNTTFSGNIFASAGSASSPSISITGDTNTGMFFPAADTIAFSEGGVESMRIDSSGNVGIGTATVDTKLHVVGGAIIEGTDRITLRRAITPSVSGTTLSAINFAAISTGSTYVNGVLILGSSEGAWSSTSAPSNLSFRTTPSASTTAVERMRIAAGGNVGIGTSNPVLGLLDINGADSTLAVRTPDTTSPTLALFVNAGSNGVGTISVDNGGIMTFDTGSTGAGQAERMRIDASGNVGIGGTTVNASLSIMKQMTALSGTGNQYGVHIYPTATGQCWIDGLTNSSSNSSLGLRTYNNGTYTEVINNSAGNTTTFQTAGTERMRIDSSGNVGIGTASPTTVTGGRSLTLYGNGTFATLSVQAFEGANNDRNATLELLSSGNGSSYSQILYGDTDTSPLTPSPLVFAGYHSGTRTERMRITPEGNVGIGTNSPDNNSGYTALSITGSTGGQIYWRSTGSSVSGYAGADSTGAYIASLSNHALIFRTNNNEKARFTSTGEFQHTPGTSNTAGTRLLRIAPSGGNGVLNIFYTTRGDGSASSSNACMTMGADNTTSRSINAAGTFNANGADYAEYMVKAGNFNINKGDICGINAQGKLTNIFTEAISFVVKSTDPSYVGGDNWANEDIVGKKPEDDATEEEKNVFYNKLEAARQTVDRIAFAGQVPVNVLGATAGQYIIHINNNGVIKGIAVSNPTFEQYQISVGKVIAIESDGRAKIIVKVA
jgi:hypothetical protein